MLVMLKTRCKKCGGDLVENYEEINCLQCGEPHGENGERIPTIDPMTIGFNNYSRADRYLCQEGGIMEAKDTVMSNVWREIVGGTEKGKISIRAELEAQAEISFKAGIKEVVEWIEAKNHPINISHIHIVKTEWQAKLKEWGK